MIININININKINKIIEKEDTFLLNCSFFIYYNFHKY